MESPYYCNMSSNNNTSATIQKSLFKICVFSSPKKLNFNLSSNSKTKSKHNLSQFTFFSSSASHKPVSFSFLSQKTLRNNNTPTLSKQLQLDKESNSKQQITTNNSTNNYNNKETNTLSSENKTLHADSVKKNLMPTLQEPSNDEEDLEKMIDFIILSTKRYTFWNKENISMNSNHKNTNNNETINYNSCRCKKIGCGKFSCHCLKRGLKCGKFCNCCNCTNK